MGGGHPDPQILGVRVRVRVRVRVSKILFMHKNVFTLPVSFTVLVHRG